MVRTGRVLAGAGGRGSVPVARARTGPARLSPEARGRRRRSRRSRGFDSRPRCDRIHPNPNFCSSFFLWFQKFFVYKKIFLKTMFLENFRSFFFWSTKFFFSSSFSTPEFYFLFNRKLDVTKNRHLEFFSLSYLFSLQEKKRLISSSTIQRLTHSYDRHARASWNLPSFRPLSIPPFRRRSGNRADTR